MIRLPKAFRILAILIPVTLGTAFLLLGQQAPSEESDWPWKIVTEGRLFLNGTPAGKLSDPAPLAKRLGVLTDQGRRSGKIDQYDTPPVLILADPDISIERISELTLSVIEGTGEPILVVPSALEKASGGGKPNPRAFAVSTENVDAAKAKRLTNLADGEIETVGHRAAILTETRPEALRIARTYESSIEIGSDGRYYLNDRTVAYELRDSTNVESRLLPVGNFAANGGRLRMPGPLKQRAVTQEGFADAVASVVKNAKTESQKVLLIVSEKARYGSLLQVLEQIDPEMSIVILVRKLESR